MNERTLLFVHGVRNDDPDSAWRASLDATLRREGKEPLGERGYTVVAPSYLAELEAGSPPETSEPAMTYIRGPDDTYLRAAGRYWSALADFEHFGLGDMNVKPSALGGLGRDGPAARALTKQLFADAEAYRTSADRRYAIYEQLLSHLPRKGELLILAHSLGSVVAADLLYYLPRGVRLRMLITMGSPLAIKHLREHLNRRRSRFPFEITGPWINLAGKADFVTGYRGVSEFFPEALDVFVDTGAHPGRAHRATAYLDQTVVARALEWVDRDERQSRAESLPPDLPLSNTELSVAIGAQYALRLEQAQPAGERRVRFGEARHLLMQEIAAKLDEAGHRHPVLRRLGSDNRQVFKSRVQPQAAVSFLLTARMMNPVAPFEIKLSNDIRLRALEKLAVDLGVTAQWARTVASAEGSARAVHDATWSWMRAAVAVAGVATVVAAPMLVIVAAPAGLTGGAAIVAGLAALGPGGMIGGLGIVGALGGAGGAVTARALTAGTAADVEETVIHLQALALAHRKLDALPRSSPEWFALVTMEDAVSEDLARLGRFSDDGARGVKELEKKLKSIRRAVQWFTDQELSPSELTSGRGS